MPDIRRIDAGVRQQVRFKRKDAQHVVHAALDFFDPLWTPSPDGGADKMHCGNARGLEAGFQVQVEIGRIHTDEHIGRRRQQPLLELFTDGHNAPVMAQDLHVTANGQALMWPPGVKAQSSHARATNAKAPGLWPALLQALNQQTSEQIARGLASHHAKGQSPRRGL